LCHPFLTLIHDRIARAPTFFEATPPLRHALVIRQEGEDRVLRMIRYTATCPEFEDKITIDKGRRRHRGRLVGEYGRNPVEHVFSFDFITRKGERLCGETQRGIARRKMNDRLGRGLAMPG
jgi:hypothetical protein